jgi:hypothetical protein
MSTRRRLRPPSLPLLLATSSSSMFMSQFHQRRLFLGLGLRLGFIRKLNGVPVASNPMLASLSLSLIPKPTSSPWTHIKYIRTLLSPSYPSSSPLSGAGDLLHGFRQASLLAGHRSLHLATAPQDLLQAHYSSGNHEKSSDESLC